MRITVSHNWHSDDYDCTVTPTHERKLLISLSIKSIDSEIYLYKIGERDLYLVELWGGEGPSMNAFDVVDNKSEAFESFVNSLEICLEYAEESEVNKKRILDEAREKLMV